MDTEIPDSQSLRLPDREEVWQKTVGWQPGTAQQAKFQQLYEQILAGNQQLNLTRITEPSEFWEKHLWDSLRGVKLLLSPTPTTYNVIDIGTGAGFPGIPVAIAQPTWTVTLLDSTRKKIQFLDTLLATLQISNAHALVGRVEALGQQKLHRASYDLALVRAVATAAVCAEYALPLVKLGGWAVLYRGHWTEEEAIALEPVVNQLGGIIDSVDTFKTPLTAGDRTCLYLKKVAPTPAEYPRAIGVPAQKPLSPAPSES